jgi:hypothetical protein
VSFDRTGSVTQPPLDEPARHGSAREIVGLCVFAVAGFSLLALWLFGLVRLAKALWSLV